jgi:hypothetical protein
MTSFWGVRACHPRSLAASLTLALCACALPVEGDAAPECTLSADCPDRGLCVAGACEPCNFGLPAPNDPCLPLCGNERGVGQPCTRLGGECNEWLNVSGAAGICTIDFVPDAKLHMCTRPCADDIDCGSDSVCIGDPKDPNSDKGCVPASCED